MGEGPAKAAEGKGKKQMLDETQNVKWKTVAILPEDHDRLRQLSKREHRALSKQISYMIKKEFEKDPESSKL